MRREKSKRQRREEKGDGEKRKGEGKEMRRVKGKKREG